MERLLYYIAKTGIAALQALPLRLVARLGRCGGAVAFRLDRRHRRVALENLERCFGRERDASEIAALARENFKRIGESYACAVRTAAMDDDEIRRILTVAGVERLARSADGEIESAIFAIGHFGNFELYARGRTFADGCQMSTTYRALKQPSLNRLLQDLREKSGCLYFERLTESAALKRALRERRIVVGLLVDQHGGDRGLRLPFLGRDCSTTPAAALYALRYGLPLHSAICYRRDLARWHLEIGPEIPTVEEGKPREVAAICLDMNRALETAVRRDPANWFWVHRRWKAGKHRSRKPQDSGPATGTPDASEESA